MWRCRGALRSHRRNFHSSVFRENWSLEGHPVESTVNRSLIKVRRQAPTGSQQQHHPLRLSQSLRGFASVAEVAGEAQPDGSGPDPIYTAAAGYNVFTSPSEFVTTWGDTLDGIDVAYETWGVLNEKKDNAVLLCAGLSASSHAKSHIENESPGWWEEFVGPGKAIDTDRFFLICCNNLGGCGGSSGPSSLNPRTNKPFGLRFPFISVLDIVKSQMLVLDHLGIGQLHAVVGSSLGGMTSLCAAANYPERVRRLVTISAAASSHPMSIAGRYAQRRALMSDPNFKNGDYYDSEFPAGGMSLSREIATMTYRSGPEWELRFGRDRPNKMAGSLSAQKPSLEAEFAIETYLRHQGSKWKGSVYDPNSVIILSKAMDLFTVERGEGLRGDAALREGLKSALMPTLVMGAKSDIIFPSWQQKQIAETLKSVGNKDVVFYELDTLYGHDTFLIDVPSISVALRGHLG